jgi:hypothetical protein
MSNDQRLGRLWTWKSLPRSLPLIRRCKTHDILISLLPRSDGAVRSATSSAYPLLAKYLVHLRLVPGPLARYILFILVDGADRKIPGPCDLDPLLSLARSNPWADLGPPPFAAAIPVPNFYDKSRRILSQNISVCVLACVVPVFPSEVPSSRCNPMPM